MQEYYKYKVPPIKILPERVTLNSMFKYAKQITKIPLGYTRDDVSLYYYNFIANKVTSIIQAEKCRVDRIEDFDLNTKEELIHELLTQDFKN